MGAWIETGLQWLKYYPLYVAPLVGAWIETPPQPQREETNEVAPLVGAWIETFYRGCNLYRCTRRTPRGCVD